MSAANQLLAALAGIVAQGEQPNVSAAMRTQSELIALTTLLSGAHTVNAMANAGVVAQRNQPDPSMSAPQTFVEMNSDADVLLGAAKKARSELQPSMAAPVALVLAKPVEKKPSKGRRSADGESTQSGYVGVRWSRKKGKWRVRIKANAKDNHVGFFTDPVSAARAYDAAAKRFYPTWKTDPLIRLNFDEDRDIPSADGQAGRPYDLKTLMSSAGSSRDTDSQSDDRGSSSPEGSVSSAPPTSTVTDTPRASKPTDTAVAQNLLLPLLAADSTKLGGKSSLEHLLDDKRTLAARTPSPQASTTPSSHPTGQYSSISTPATLSSPSTIWSPHASRSQSTNRNAAVDTPPNDVGPPRLSKVAPGTAGFVAPAVCAPGNKTANSLSVKPPQPKPSKEDGPDEIEALRGLVALSCNKKDAAPADFSLADNIDPAAKKAGAREKAKAEAQGEPRTKRTLEAAFPPPAPPVKKQKPAPQDAASTVKAETMEAPEKQGRKNQHFRGVTWDKVKQMWRVRLCLAGGGREHIGYFADEHEGAMAYARALHRLKNELPPSAKIEYEHATHMLMASPALLQPTSMLAAEQRGAFSHVCPTEVMRNVYMPVTGVEGK